MISAKEALQNAKPSNTDIVLADEAMSVIDQHLRDKMTFAGPSDVLEIKAHKLSYAAAKLVALRMTRLGWNMVANFGVKQSQFGGNTQIWQLQFSPTIEVYETFLADFEIEQAKTLS